MKRSLLVPLGLAFLGAVGFVGCPAPVDITPATSGGAVGTSGGSVGTSGGSVGTSGGSVGTSGGSVGTSGGSVGTTGGSVGTTGGSVGTTGGSVGTTGGSTGTGGRGTGGAGGAVGGTTGTGGRGTGGAVGGTTGTGGRGTGGAGTGGAGTGGAAGASGALPTVGELFPAGTEGSLDGRLITMPCGENTTGTDCASFGAYYRSVRTMCSGGALTIVTTHTVGGVAGRMYRASMHFYGIAEPKDYGPNVTREATGRPGTQDSGATPTPWATGPANHTYPVSDYNTYEIHVDNNMNQEVAVYYLNADTAMGHWSYVLNYTKQITVIGGGRVRAKTYDRNCRQIKNCGAADSYPCTTKATNRIINVSAAMPAPANASATTGGLMQPGMVAERDGNNAGQWLLIDVVSVDSQM